MVLSAGIFWVVGVGGHFLWVSGGDWRFILEE